MSAEVAENAEPDLVIPEPPRAATSGNEEKSSFLWAGAFVLMLAGCILTQLLTHS